MIIDKSQYSLALLRGIEAVITSFVKIEEQSGDVITEAIPGSSQDQEMVSLKFKPYHLSYVASDASLGFYFEIRGVRQNGNSIEYWTSFKPQHGSTLDAAETHGKLDQTETRFNNWVNLLREYASVRLSKKERFEAQSTEQFYADFEIADEDANANPFDNDKQIVLYKLLEYIKEKIENEEGADQEQASVIINEIRLLQASIPNVTKATAIKGLSKIFAKTKSFSLRLMIDLLDVAKKEALKAALYGGLHEADTFFHSFHTIS